MRLQLETQLNQKYEKKLNAEIEKIRKQQEKSIREEIEDNIRAEYIVEPVLNKKIEDAVEQAISNKTLEYLISTLDKISKSYVDGESGTGEGDYQRLRTALEKYFESFINNSIINASQECETPIGKIKDELRVDLKDFITQYLLFVAEQSKNNYNPVRLSTILKLIEKA